VSAANVNEYLSVDQPHRQRRDVRRDPLRLVAGEQFS
jgi:hypothetical protein